MAPRTPKGYKLTSVRWPVLLTAYELVRLKTLAAQNRRSISAMAALLVVQTKRRKSRDTNTRARQKKIVQVSFTGDEWRDVEQRATKADMDTGRYVRQALRAALT